MEASELCQLVRCTDDKLNLPLASGVWRGRGGVVRPTESLTCVTGHCLQEERVRIELNYKTPSWCFRELLGAKNLHTSGVRAL